MRHNIIDNDATTPKGVEMAFWDGSLDFHPKLIMACAFSTKTGPAHEGLKTTSAFSIRIENAPSLGHRDSQNHDGFWLL
jgi:hypothetical protein